MKKRKYVYQNGSIHLMHQYYKAKIQSLIIMQHNNLKKRGQLSESNVCQHGVGTSSM